MVPAWVAAAKSLILGRATSARYESPDSMGHELEVGCVKTPKLATIVRLNSRDDRCGWTPQGSALLTVPDESNLSPFYFSIDCC